MRRAKSTKKGSLFLKGGVSGFMLFQVYCQPVIPAFSDSITLSLSFSLSLSSTLRPIQWHGVACQIIQGEEVVVDGKKELVIYIYERVVNINIYESVMMMTTMLATH